MANMKTVVLTEEQYREIVKTINSGFLTSRPNNQVATILTIQANLGLRIGDVLDLKLNSIIKDGNRYRLDIVEEKTQKKREFTVTDDIYNYLVKYCYDNSIEKEQPIFKLSSRAVQKHLKLVCDYLGYENISTHSFRKFFATMIYNNNNYNVVLVQQLLQHSSPTVTQKYLGVSTKDVETALNNHNYLNV